MARKKAEAAESGLVKVKLSTSCVSFPHSVVIADENGIATVPSDLVEGLKALGVLVGVVA